LLTFRKPGFFRAGRAGWNYPSHLGSSTIPRSAVVSFVSLGGEFCWFQLFQKLQLSSQFDPSASEFFLGFLDFCRESR